MAELDGLNIRQRKKLRSFFSNFEDFRKPSTTYIRLKDGTDLNRKECLDILRTNLSGLSDDKFKDDSYLLNYLSIPRNQDEVLKKLYKNEWDELSQAIKPETQQLETDSMADQSAGGEPSQPATGEGGHAAGGGMPSMPHTPSVSRPRIIQNIPASAQEGGTGTGTAATNKAERFAQENPATAKINQQKYADSASKTPSIQTTRTSNPIPARPPTAVVNAAKNFGSSASIFTSNASRGVTRGLGNMLGGIGRGLVGPGLTGASNFLGRAGIGGINAFSRLSSQMGGGGVFRKGLFGKNTGKRVAWAFLGIFIVFGLFAGLTGGLGGGTTPGGTIPVVSPIPISSGGIPPGSFAYYYQNNPAYLDSCRLEWTLCGPTSLAMIASTLGVPLNPKQADEVFISSGWRSCGNGPSSDSNMHSAVNSSWFTGMGFQVQRLGVPLNLEAANQLLNDKDSNGNRTTLILGSVDIHIFVVDAVNPIDNTVHLRDPDKGGDPSGYWSPNHTPWTSDVSGAKSWTYAYSIKKI